MSLGTVRVPKQNNKIVNKVSFFTLGHMSALVSKSLER